MKSKKHNKENNYILISPFMTQANVKPFDNLVNIIDVLANSIKVIVLYGENVLLSNDNQDYIQKRHKSGKSPIKRIVFYFIDELFIAYYIAINKQYSNCIFFIGEVHVIPFIVAKIFRKKTILVLGGSIEKLLAFYKDQFSTIIKVLKKISLILSNKIIVYSKHLVNEWDLGNYTNKISIAHRHYINTNQFKINVKYKNRDNIIGYIGRLSEEKGIINFIKSIPLINKKYQLNYIIGGSGQLNEYINDYLDEENLHDNVQLVGWIPHQELPSYLNQLKLLILPSFSEGLNNVMLEAMACGVPVLATPVGAVPDVIKDYETGFILTNNSPECIAECIIDVINFPDVMLEQISKNAQEFIKKEFTFEKTLEKWRRVLGSVL
ncbi:MAG: glycosyltransferase family 4 protein [Peptococcia bacterium]|jgi:glycosyltransferase involved in cell wall biosynthesis